MRHPISRTRVIVIIVGLLVVLTLAGVALTVAMIPSSRPSMQTSPEDKATAAAAPICATLYVQLGSPSPSIACADARSSAAPLTPLSAAGTPCAESGLWLFSERDRSGTSICISGTGNLNLADVRFGNGVWDNITDSYWTSCATGNFWSDPNQSGRSQSFSAQQKRNFEGNMLPWSGIAVNTLSSLTVTTNC